MGLVILPPWYSAGPLTAGLVAWWKADSLGLNDGDAISSWADSAGNGYTATQTTAGKQPIYKAGIKNGYPVARFTAASTQFFTLVQPVADQAFTYIFAGRGAGAILSRASDAPRWRISGATSTLAIVAGAALGTTSGISLNTTTWYVGLVRYASPAGAFRFNGAAAGSFSTAATFASFPTTVLGARQPTGLNDLWDGDFAEILVYNRSLSDSECAAVETYLNAKYAIY